MSLTPQSEVRAVHCLSQSMQEQSNVSDGLRFRAGMEHIASINQALWAEFDLFFK